MNELSGNHKKKSALEEFAKKYFIKGKPDVTTIEYFKDKALQLKDFLRNYRHIKVRFILSDKPIYIATKAYFHTKTHINLEVTDVKKVLAAMIKEILEQIDFFQNNGSGWYFKGAVNLEIHSVDNKPMRGSSYISLPDFIMRK